MPATPKTAKPTAPSMIEAYFLKKVAKPFDWAVIGIEHRRSTYRVEVIGIEDGTLHVGVHRIAFDAYCDRKVGQIQLPDIAFALGGTLGRDEILDRVVVMADQKALTSLGNGFPPRLVELLDSTNLGHMVPYRRG